MKIPDIPELRGAFFTVCEIEGIENAERLFNAALAQIREQQRREDARLIMSLAPLPSDPYSPGGWDEYYFSRRAADILTGKHEE